MSERTDIVGLGRCLVTAGLLFASALVTAQPVRAAADQCFADWSAAAPVVRREALTSTKDLHEQARARKLGHLVKITLCEAPGGYVYRLVLFDKGRLNNLTVDARLPL
jgi:hypothetical protein